MCGELGRVPHMQYTDWLHRTPAASMNERSYSKEEKP
jgi:hypothetical protein